MTIHPCKTSEGVSTKFDKNKIITSGVKELSKIAPQKWVYEVSELKKWFVGTH